MNKISAFLSATFLPQAAKAIDLGSGGLGSAAATAQYSKSATLDSVIGSVISIFLGLLGVIFLVLIVYGGYQWLIARGDEGRVELAKDTITRAIIGLVIVMAAYAISYYVIYYLLKASIK